MTFILFYDPEDGEYGVITSTCKFSGWSNVITNLPNDLSSWKDETAFFVGTTPEAWATTQANFQYLGSFPTIPTRDSHPELFL